MQEKDGNDALTPEEAASVCRSSKQQYHPPTLTYYGSLVDLVLSKEPGGPDAAVDPSCSHPPT